MQTNNRKGFSLIELLIVVVIIGILAAIAIPKFANTKEKAYIAQMKSDLKNLASAQESYFADNNAYANLAAIQAAPYSWTVSGGAQVTPNITAAAGGWSATLLDARVTSAGATDNCGIYAGGVAAPNAAVTAEGVVGCWP
ncbi:prepilin-type N-terminal cleavage/methylation domain-containing protein [Roseisolibacter sp. H3M3-2]|uniref:type IV pilin protein n=1 Tax=Roseisolibacter sp. H3M3-2 TaxID=3031323 RepID=UPI0023DC1254|nr:prepilin-type N-terminal cleavage/methylation domain-containing protein [Roseisolibacter sp. H3M3-2]MDF1503702.1 prepilin-type N-terminal cleavage/methylation domain-containing protein [Roseisolibacter sp. H3M3-2]